MKLHFLYLAIFIILSVVLLLVSGAPLKVHAVDIGAFAIAYLIPGIIAQRYNGRKAFFILLAGAIIGVVLFDLGLSYVVVKRDFFMGWYIFYPVLVAGLLLLHSITKLTNKKLPYNKSTQPTSKSGAAGF